MVQPLQSGTPIPTSAFVAPQRGWRRIGVGVLIGLIISMILLFVALRDIRWRLLGDSLHHARLLPVLIATSGYLSFVVVTGLRWKVLLGIRRLRFIDLFEILTIGFLCNLVLPARGGDMVRVMVLNQRERVHISEGIASVVLEKLFDVTALVVLLIPALIWVDLPRWVLFSLTVAVIGVIVGFVLCIALARSSRDVTSLPLANRLPARVRVRADSFFASFRDGLRLLFSWKKMLTVSLLSLAIWMINAISGWILLAGLGIAHISLGAIFVIIAIINLGLIVPSSPGSVGSYEFFAISALALFHIAREPALEYALVSHLLSSLIVLALGAASMARFGYSLATVSRRVVNPEEGSCL